MKYDIFDRGFVSVARATAVVATLCFAAAAPVMAADQPSTNTQAMTPAPTASPPKGEFDNSCTYGLATGQVVKTNCSTNWTEPDGKVYCFSRESSKEAFLKTTENIQKAREPMITRMPVAWWWLPVQEHPGSTEVTRAWHVMSAIHNYIATHKDKDGNLEIKDDKTGENLPLEFVEIHQPVRHLKKEGEYFACTDFRKPGSQDEYYDIDFWVNQKTGKLEVDNVKVHKVPVQQDGVWTQVPRYNFEGMDIEETN